MAPVITAYLGIVAPIAFCLALVAGWNLIRGLIQ